MLSDARSVTSSVRPSALNATCAGSLELAVGVAAEHDHLVVVGVVRLNVDKAMLLVHRDSFRLPLSHLPSSEAVARYTDQRRNSGPGYHREPVTRVAAVDIGTNSTRPLVADVEGGRISDLERDTRVTRLGEGV